MTRTACNGLCETAACGCCCDAAPPEVRPARQSTHANIDASVGQAYSQGIFTGLLWGLVSGGLIGAALTLIMEAGKL